MSSLDVSEFLVKHNIKDTTELYALAQERIQQKTYELLQNTWQMEEAAEVLYRASTLRMEIQRKVEEEDYAAKCGGMWLQCSYEVIINNNIHPYAIGAGEETRQKKKKNCLDFKYLKTLLIF